jgi:hypothetical protein
VLVRLAVAGGHATAETAAVFPAQSCGRHGVIVVDYVQVAPRVVVELCELVVHVGKEGIACGTTADSDEFGVLRLCEAAGKEVEVANVGERAAHGVAAHDEFVCVSELRGAFRELLLHCGSHGAVLSVESAVQRTSLDLRGSQVFPTVAERSQLLPSEL